MHAVPARRQVLGRMVDVMTTRAQKAAALERWANAVADDDLRAVDTTVLQELRRLADQRATVEAEVVLAVRRARAANRSWSEIGAMLGVSKQAAQRKYGRSSSAA